MDLLPGHGEDGTEPAMIMPPLPRLEGTTFALDFETKDPFIDSHGPGWAFPDSARFGHVVGVGLSWDEGRGSCYLPVAHETGDNVDEDAVRQFLADALGDSSNTVVMHHRLYDEGWWRRWGGGRPLRAKAYDTVIGCSLLNEYRYSYGLHELGMDYLGEGKDESIIRAFAAAHKLHPKRDIYRMPFNIVSGYGSQDPVVTLKLWRHIAPLLIAEDLREVFMLENQLIPCLLEMRWRGVRVDEERAHRTSHELELQERRLQQQLNEDVGFTINVNAPTDLDRAWHAAGLAPMGLTPKTKKPQYTKEGLAAHPHPLAQAILGIRRLSKVRSTFVDGLLSKVVAGRVHGEFNPVHTDEGGAVTGRFSSSKPNLQNQPAKDPVLGPMVRSLFLPEEHQEWAAIDFSSQEPRLTVHFAAVAGAKGATAAVRAYRENPRLDYHQWVADLTGLKRSDAKIINLALSYGMGGAKLCRSLGLSTIWVDKDGKGTMVERAGPEGQAILDQYHAHLPYVRILSDECARRAERRGWIRTIGGRKCRFESGYGQKSWFYKAMNKLIQGSAADWTKRAMLRLWDAGYVPLVTVHDEVGLSLEDRASQLAPAVELMTSAYHLYVPMLADVAIGPSWGEAVELEEAA